MSDAPAWAIVGAQVAEWDYRSVGIAVVEKLTPTQIVLTNGNRYRKSRLRRGLPGTWSGSVELRPLDDPQVERALRQQRVRNAARRIETLARQLGSKPDDLTPAHELRGVVERLLGQVAE